VPHPLPTPSKDAAFLEALLGTLPPERQAYVREAALRLFLEAAADSLTDEDRADHANLADWLPEHAEAQVWA